MTLFDLLTQTAISDTDLLRKSNELGDVFATPREVEPPKTGVFYLFTRLSLFTAESSTSTTLVRRE